MSALSIDEVVALLDLDFPTCAVSIIIVDVCVFFDPLQIFALKY